MSAKRYVPPMDMTATQMQWARSRARHLRNAFTVAGWLIVPLILLIGLTYSGWLLYLLLIVMVVLLHGMVSGRRACQRIMDGYQKALDERVDIE